VINTGEVTPRDFTQRGPACTLSDSGRRAFLQAYSRRMEQDVRHPQLGYSVSYRRLLLVQARLFARFCAGEIAHYPGFMTR
jgi:CRISPR/Cas system-associated endonuclease Cas1